MFLEFAHVVSVLLATRYRHTLNSVSEGGCLVITKSLKTTVKVHFQVDSVLKTSAVPFRPFLPVRVNLHCTVYLLLNAIKTASVGCNLVEKECDFSGEFSFFNLKKVVH